ncbi:hypothetical protein [Pseudoxanthomonas winnipegensis]|uniref:Uncharacterized protein n=1 Tax=Pseudoxanthomonas winnipegensis TaxID=2480810 RepID=A0A4Q8L479_9GAMM|nr:hypothetical protein [Pseudoxanthomonas winnipegensis]TAA19046.1 hypothetical protein EA660_20080 [Pseudoxanthomonas winnipegensis]
MQTAVPIYFGSPAAAQLAADLRDHGLAVVETMRTAADHLADEVERELGLPPDSDDGEDFLLHLSCLIEPAQEFGWIDYYVYPRAFALDAMAAKPLVAAAVQQWAGAGRPARYTAQISR